MPIAFLSACSGLTGYLLAPRHSLSVGTMLTAAVFLMAAGASALNQYQERNVDALMERTRSRPLPAGSIKPSAALFFALMLVSAGLFLNLFIGTTPFLLGIFALVWYNGIYTPLKRFTAFAAIPGAVVGMIPPAMGWSAAGGALLDPRLAAVCFLFFMWQVPHFWLQVLDHGKDYEQAGLPCLTSLISKEQLSRMIFIWVCAVASAGLLLPLYGAMTSPMVYFLLIPGACLIVAGACRLMQDRGRARAAFRLVNLYIAFVMCLVSLESLFLRMP